MPQKQTPDDASRALGQSIDEARDRPTTIKVSHLLVRIRKYLTLDSTDPLADADRINDLLDRIRRLCRRSSPAPAKEPNMVKDDPVSETNAVVTANHPARSPELDALLADVVEHPETWMSTPSVQFGGRRPIDLVGTEEEVKIFDILHAVDQGLF
jgi:Antitoxin Xre/MbcA/ParS C-terminal toxin-binding domain